MMYDAVVVVLSVGLAWTVGGEGAAIVVVAITTLAMRRSQDSKRGSRVGNA